MESKFVLAVLMSLFFNVVNSYFELEPPTDALDNSLYEEVLDEEQCAEQIEMIRSNTLLTMYFGDASIRIPKGVLQGNTLDMGSYHQCLGINMQLQDSELQGKYCAIQMPIDQNWHLPELPGLPQIEINNFDPKMLQLDNETIRDLQEYYVLRRGFKSYSGIINDDRLPGGNPLSGMELTLGVCIPKPCTTRQAFDSFLFNISAVGFEYRDLYCRLPNDKPWVGADYAAIVVFSILGFVTLISTMYDLWHQFVRKTDPKTVNQLATSFSAYTNGRRLMTFTSGPDTVECLDGIRALAMAWVLLGHAFTSEISWSNPIDTFLWSGSWQALWVVGAHYTVDTFFTLSGFLVVYNTVGKVNTKGLLKNLHLFYLNRLLRMFPLLSAAVLLEASYLNRMTDGPNWTLVADTVQRCRAAWWSTMLHIQNYMNPRTTCIGQSWYLAIDVQLHMLSPLILVWVLWGKRKIAWTALSIGLVSVLAASTTYIFINKFPPVMIAAGREHEMMTYLVYYYVNTLTRAPPFLVGMAFGYAVRVSKIKLTGIPVIIFWTLFFTLTTYLMYFNLPINRADWDNQVVTSFYNSFFRSFWAFAVGCLIYACMNGFAGPINWLLSLQVWKLHSRLSYAMYLFHYMLMLALNYTAIGPIYFSPGLVTFKFLAHYSLCLAVSFLMTLLIDAPFSTIFKRMLGGGVKKQSKKVEDIEPKETAKQV